MNVILIYLLILKNNKSIYSKKSLNLKRFKLKKRNPKYLISLKAPFKIFLHI